MPSLKDKFGTLLDDVEGFSGTSAAEKAAAASFSAIETPLNEFVDDFRSQQVATGRFRTGFRFEDEDRLVRDSFRDLNRTLAQNSLQSAGLDLQGLRTRGELISAGLDRETADKNAKRRRRAGLFGLGGAILGTAIPGVGTVLGGVLGEAIGGFI